jgi:hypothetical protein
VYLPHPLTRSLRSGARLVKAGLWASVLSVMGVGLGAGIQACGSDAQDTTGGKRVALHTRVAVDAIATSQFTSAVGWQVTLTKALVAAGPFYYFDGAPPLVLRERRKTWQYAARLLGLGVAHAHPGHYQAGSAMGQMLESASIDLLAGTTTLPDGDGVSGSYRSARFTFATPAGAGSRALEGHPVSAEGKAEKDGEPPRFYHAFADLDAIEKSASQAHIEGCEFSEVDVEADGTVIVTVNPKIWFDLVDFTEAEQGSADAPVDLPQGSQPQLAFVLGVTQLSAYKFSYASP